MKDRRTTSLFILISITFFVLVARLAGLQLISAQKYRRLAKENYVKPIVIESPRGIIYSRDGIVLADNIPTYTVEIDSAKASGEELEGIASLFTDSTRIPVNKYRIRKVPFDVVCRIQENRKDFPNVSVRAHPLRTYCYSEVFSHLIGYTAEISKKELAVYSGYRLGTTVGKAGAEKEYERFLKGKDGTRYVEIDVTGCEQGVLSSVSPEPGCDLWLNVHAELQLLAYEILPDKGACVAMDPTNGEVLLWVSKPGFDPNAFPCGISVDVWNKWVRDSLSPLWDRVEKGSFPPASVFKLVTCAAALERGIVESGTYQPISCTGSMLIRGRKYECWETHGPLDLIGSIIHSCDIYFYQLGMQLGVEGIMSQARKARFGTKTRVDLPGELSGFLPSVKWYEKRYGKGAWGKGISANLAIGQGEILTTPLQMLYFVSGIANKGVMCTPRVVSRAVNHLDQEVFANSPGLSRLPWKSETIEVLRRGMLGVVNAMDGTGRAAAVPGIKVAGKTGTAQNPTGDHHAWFAAFAPYQKPRICIVVFVEHGGMGGSVAAPIAGRILKRFFGCENPMNKPHPAFGGAGSTQG